MRIKVTSIGFLFGIVLIHPFKIIAYPAIDSSAFIKVYEDSIKSLQYVRLNAYADKDRDTANAKMVRLMKKALSLPGSFNYPFDSLRTIGVVMSPDKQFRIITWDVPRSGCNFGYYGFIQSYNARKKKYNLFVLEDHRADISNTKTGLSTPNKWIGMLYYKIIKEKNTNFYTLLAWQGYNKMITCKIIDVLTFNAEGVPSFGKSVYQKLPASFKGNPKRLIFQYSSQVTMSLKYDAVKNRIIFDHLAPIDDGLGGQYQYYGPSFQVDALEWKNGTWEYVANVDARNPNNSEDEQFNDPKHPTHQVNNKVIYSAPH